jgi:hypothetical protein
MSTPEEFGGQKRHEHGQSFGMSESTYGRLADCAMGLKREIGIEPCALDHLENGRRGCSCVLYGKHLCFTITIDAESDPALLSLSAIQLDVVDQPDVPILDKVYDGMNEWGQVVDAIQGLEGRAMNYEAACELLRKFEP